MSYLVSFCSCVFSPFSVRITSLGEEIANPSAIVRFFDLRLFCFFLFPLPLCLGRAVVCDCGTPWTFLLLFYNGKIIVNTVALSVSIVFCETYI